MSGEKGSPQKLTKIIFETNFSKLLCHYFDYVHEFREILFKWIAPKNFATFTLLTTCHCHALLPLKIVYIERREERNVVRWGNVKSCKF